MGFKPWIKNGNQNGIKYGIKYEDQKNGESMGLVFVGKRTQGFSSSAAQP